MGSVGDSIAVKFLYRKALRNDANFDKVKFNTHIQDIWKVYKKKAANTWRVYCFYKNVIDQIITSPALTLSIQWPKQCCR